jgi:hypothetical protein
VALLLSAGQKLHLVAKTAAVFYSGVSANKKKVQNQNKRIGLRQLIQHLQRVTFIVFC